MVHVSDTVFVSSSEECLSENYHKLTEVLIMILFLAVVVWLAGVVGWLLALIVLWVAEVLRRDTCITCVTRLYTCITRGGAGLLTANTTTRPTLPRLSGGRGALSSVLCAACVCVTLGA